MAQIFAEAHPVLPRHIQFWSENSRAHPKSTVAHMIYKQEQGCYWVIHLFVFVFILVSIVFMGFQVACVNLFVVLEAVSKKNETTRGNTAKNEKTDKKTEKKNSKSSCLRMRMCARSCSRGVRTWAREQLRIFPMLQAHAAFFSFSPFALRATASHARESEIWLWDWNWDWNSDSNSD